jgi:hypothetical protein
MVGQVIQANGITLFHPNWLNWPYSDTIYLPSFTLALTNWDSFIRGKRVGGGR